MASLSSSEKDNALLSLAQLIEKHQHKILAANKKDCDEQKGKISNALYGRLVLTEDKIKSIIQGIHDLTNLQDPCGKTLSQLELDDDLILTKVSVPLGVVTVIFESRPDVIPQILSLMLKSGNCCLLKGGKEALRTNQAFMDVVSELNQQVKILPQNWATLIESREDVRTLLSLQQYIDLVIPRGSNELVQFIQSNTKIPVLGHADGVCHIFVDDYDFAKATQIIIDAKTQYPSACNAVETILVNTDLAKDFLPLLAKALNENHVKYFACTEAQKTLLDTSSPDSWHVEYSDLALSIKVVSDVTTAIDHINEFGSRHTDVILTNNKIHENTFVNLVDSSTVMVNASSRFADGFRYGMGAEVGISTNKTHARGPVGLDGLVIYKYILKGQGNVVSDYTGPKAKAFTHKKRV